MSAPRPYATDPFRTYSSVPLTILRMKLNSIHIFENIVIVSSMWWTFLVRLKEFAHLLNILKGRMQSFFKHEAKTMKNCIRLFFPK